MGTFKLVVAMIIALAGTVGICLDTTAVAGELDVPNTGGDVSALCYTVVNRAKEYNKSVEEYIEDGGNIALFVPDNDQEYIGRLHIESVGVNVALYDSWKQSVCDARDSACMFNYGTHRVIADHWNQGFEAIKSCKVGDVAYITDGEKTEKFICVKILDGHNTDDGSLTDSEYNDFYYDKSEDLIMYTCNGNWRNVKFVIFEKM